MEWVWHEEAVSKESLDEDSADSEPETFVPGRDAFGKMGFCEFWSVPIHAKLKQLRNKHKLKWLRIRVACHRFSNLNEMFQGDLSRKMMEGIKIRDYDH